MTETNETPRQLCGAKLNGRPGTCRRPAGWGTPYAGHGRCKLHGGLSPNAIAAAQQAAAAQAVATYGLPRDIDPFTALDEELKRTAGHVAWLEQVIRNQDPEALVWGITEKTRRKSGEFPGTDTRLEAKPSVWLALYQSERKHLAEVSRVMISLGIEARMARVDGLQAAQMFAVFSRTLEVLGLSLADPRVGEALSSEIEAVVGRSARAIDGVSW